MLNIFFVTIVPRVAVQKFDNKLMELYKMRLAIEKSILAEELKILIHDRQISVQDQIDREEERLLWVSAVSRNRRHQPASKYFLPFLIRDAIVL